MYVSSLIKFKDLIQTTVVNVHDVLNERRLFRRIFIIGHIFHGVSLMYNSSQSYSFCYYPSTIMRTLAVKNTYLYHSQ